MTSTPVKDIGLIFANQPKASGSKSSGEAKEFQQVWNNQMGKSPERETAGVKSGKTVDKGKSDDRATEVTEESGKVESREPAAAQESRPVKSEESQDSERPEEISDVPSVEELEAAMEVLGTTALDLMLQIANAFDIPVDELQQVMEELGMEPTDVLKSENLTSLLLNLGGAEDSYALVTDEQLYDTYKTLTAQLESVLQESTETLDMDPELLVSLLTEKAEVPEEIPIEEISVEEISAGKTPVEKILPEEIPPEEIPLEEIPPEEVIPAERKVRDEAPLQNDTPEFVAGSETADVREVQNVQDHTDSRESDQDRKPGENADRSRQADFVEPNFRAEQFAPEVRQADEAGQISSWDVDTQDIMRQIMDYMRIQLSAGDTNLEMQLHPASLGTLQIQIASKGGVVTASFITQNEAVKAALESQMVQLKESFEEQGVKVEAIEVTVQTHEFERNLEQGRGRNQQEPEKKNRTRRINLNDPLSMEAMEEEDALAAEVLTAGGSTVDFTA